LYLQRLPAPRFPTSDVQRYYDANTEAFVRHGQGGSLGAIHRAVWGPGVTDRARAFRYVEDLILRELETVAPNRPAHVLDLGCGVGGSLAYLAEQRPLQGTGVTISPVQARLGQERLAALGLAGRMRIIEGDYCALPAAIEHVDLAYAIESFVHGPSPERFLAEAARVLVPNGVLVVCDDFRTDAENRGPHKGRATASAQAARTLARFVRGWHVNTLLSAGELQDLAAHAGFTHVMTTDLTPYLELRRPRDRAIALLAAALGWVPALSRRLAPLAGGAALQRGLARGWIAYHCVVFRKK
jgi:ubiquinone/menaquinone biosynthesis C-methylase UbiE